MSRIKKQSWPAIAKLPAHGRPWPNCQAVARHDLFARPWPAMEPGGSLEKWPIRHHNRPWLPSGLFWTFQLYGTYPAVNGKTNRNTSENCRGHARPWLGNADHGRQRLAMLAPPHQSFGSTSGSMLGTSFDLGRRFGSKYGSMLGG